VSSKAGAQAAVTRGHPGSIPGLRRDKADAFLPTLTFASWKGPNPGEVWGWDPTEVSNRREALLLPLPIMDTLKSRSNPHFLNIHW
jgi:hypothetical protein